MLVCTGHSMDTRSWKIYLLGNTPAPNSKVRLSDVRVQMADALGKVPRINHQRNDCDSEKRQTYSTSHAAVLPLNGIRLKILSSLHRRDNDSPFFFCTWTVCLRIGIFPRESTSLRSSNPRTSSFRICLFVPLTLSILLGVLGQLMAKHED